MRFRKSFSSVPKIRMDDNNNEQINLSYLWIVIGGIGAIYFYYRKSRIHQQDFARTPLPPKTAEEIQREQELDIRRAQTVSRLQNKYTSVSTKTHEDKKKRHIEELDKKLALIDGLNKSEPSMTPSHQWSSAHSVSKMSDPSTSTSTTSGRLVTCRDNGSLDTVDSRREQSCAEEDNFIWDFLSDEEYEYNMNYKIYIGQSPNLQCTGIINGKIWDIVVDTGATYTLINEKLVANTHAQMGKIPPRLNLLGPSGEPLDLIGAVTITISIGNEFKVEHKTLVCRNLKENLILGCDFHKSTV